MLALDGTDCYHGPQSADCWSFNKDVTSNLSIQSFAFASQDASTDFKANFAQRDVAVQGLVLDPVQKSNAARKRQASFFSGKREQEHDAPEDDVVDEAAVRNREELQSVRWMIFAVKAFLLRFWGLAKVRFAVQMGAIGSVQGS